MKFWRDFRFNFARKDGTISFRILAKGSDDFWPKIESILSKSPKNYPSFAKMTHHNAPERLFMIISMIRNSIYDDLDECYSDLTSHNFDEINFIITGTKTYIFWKPYGHLGSILRGLSVIKWCHDRDSYQKLWPDTNNELKPLWYFDRKLWFFIISGLILIKIITKNKHMRFTVLTHLSGYACESCWLITNQIISDLEANTLKLPTVWLWDLKKCALKSCSFQNKGPKTTIFT